MNPRWITWYLESGEYSKSTKRWGAYQRAAEEHREVLGEPLAFSEWYKKCPKHLIPKDPPKGITP